MRLAQHTWALVLGAGDGTRLRSLTTDSNGVAVPKQFCSLAGGRSLLEETVERASAVVSPERVVSIVAEQHRRWWQSALGELPDENIIVQPRNRGTAVGILLPLLEILDRDPHASILFLPSDHFVREEWVLRESIRRAAERIGELDEAIVLLGISPEEADPELGYIVPGRGDGRGTFSVRRFVEKPEPALATQLLKVGSVWNSFIMAADGGRMLELYAERFPEVVTAMIGAMKCPHRRKALTALYEELPDIDFSRHLLAGSETRLRLLTVPRCGWSDLGTPKRVAQTLERLPKRRDGVLSAARAAFLDLSAAHLRLQVVG